MEKKYLERLVGQHSKIITREPGEKKLKVINGIVEEIDYQDGFIVIDSEDFHWLELSHLQPQPQQESLQ